MKILFVGYLLEKASGVTTFVERTACELRRLDHDVDVVDAAKAKNRIVDAGGYDVVHLHCLWQLHSYARSAFDAGIPVVWSTHGMTAPWSMRHKWWKKHLAWWLFQKRDLQKAAAVHCTTEQEIAWNNALGITKCFLAPLGSDMPANSPRVDAGNGRILLFVGRIYPVKGLENLIRAWKIARDAGEMQDWRLRIVGPDEAGHRSELEELVAQLGLTGCVEFPGPKFDGELDSEYENCACLVLPSFTENFGATVVDAMAHSKPVIASTFTPWREVSENGCGWWVSNEPSSLAAAIRSLALMTDGERAAMGGRGRALVESRYTWKAAVETLESKYGEVVVK